MIEQSTALREEEIRSCLQTSWLGVGDRLHVMQETGSTNEDVKKMAKEGAPEGTLLVAGHQNAGKGSKGRVWQSPRGTTIAFSILLRPSFGPEKASMLTLVIAHSVALAVEKVAKEAGFLLKPGIKWPNDIVLDKKKICGILTEMAAVPGQINSVVIGVGVNVNVEEFAPDVADKATSLLLICGRPFSREQVLAEIQNQFEKDYKVFCQSENLSGLKESYEERLLSKDTQVRILDPKGEYTGIARGIDENGQLLVEVNGELQKVFADEVSVRGLYSYV